MRSASMRVCSASNLFGDFALVKELDELLLLASEFPQPAGVAAGFAAGDLGLGVDVGVERLADCVLLSRGEREDLVAGLDGAFHRFNTEVGRGATSATLHAAEATEVVVYPALFAAMTTVTQPLAADAVERALQVVAVFVGAVAARTVTVQHLLHLLEGLGVDDGLVSSLALGALASHDPGVEVVKADAATNVGRRLNFTSGVGERHLCDTWSRAGAQKRPNGSLAQTMRRKATEAWTYPDALIYSADRKQAGASSRLLLTDRSGQGYS